MLCKPPTLMKVATCIVPTCVTAEEPGCVTETTPSFEIVTVNASAGIVMLGCTG